MATYGLKIYSLRIYERRTQEPLILSDFTTNLDFLNDILPMYVRHTTDIQDVTRIQKAYKIMPPVIGNRNIKGIIEAGMYGAAAPIVDVETRTQTHEKGTTEAELSPFYYNIFVPVDSDLGFLALQSTGHSSAKFVINSQIIRQFNRSFPALTLKLHPLLPIEFIEELYGGARLVSVVLSKRGVPRATEDMLYDGASQQQYKTELTISAKGNANHFLRRVIADFFRGERNVGQIIELINAEYNELKTVVEVDGRQKTINFSALDAMRPNYDITEHVEIDDNGHPTFESIDQATTDIIARLAESLEIQDVV